MARNDSDNPCHAACQTSDQCPTSVILHSTDPVAPDGGTDAKGTHFSHKNQVGRLLLRVVTGCPSGCTRLAGLEGISPHQALIEPDFMRACQLPTQPEVNEGKLENQPSV